jgi:hypothetical protein
MIIALSVGCDRGAVVQPPAPSVVAAPLLQPPTFYTVSGTVSEVAGGALRPAAGRSVELWVRQQTGPSSFAMSSLSASTDRNGRYSVRSPEGLVSVSAWRQGEVQPCLAVGSVQSDTTLDVTVMSAQEEASGAALEHLIAVAPVVQGVVYENGAAGRLPLRGATIWVDVALEVYHAVARTDASGRFMLCRVNAPVSLEVELLGFRWTALRIQGNEDREVEIELARQ